MRGEAGVALVVTAFVHAASLAAQVSGTKAQTADAAVTLDQLSVSNGARTSDRAVDVDVAQPPRPSRAAAVTSAEITDRADGRAVATAPLPGEDRCDAMRGKARLDLCRRSLEARANQYSRPVPAAITPEGRLLLLTRPADPAMSAGAGSRTLGTVSGLNDPNGPAEQIAGALRDRAQDAGAAANQPRSADAAALPPGVPATVVLPTK